MGATNPIPTDAAPRVSVLMAVHNTAPFLEEACRSILEQSFRELELVALDDGSRDGSLALLRALAAEDPRLRVVSRENRGLIATRNELLQLARAPLVAWMDSDDRSPVDRIARQASRFASDPELVCLGGAILEVDPEGEPIHRIVYPCTHEEIVEGARLGGLMTFGSTMMRREAALAVGSFREPFLMGEDFDLMLRLAEVGKLENLADVLLHYRQHLNSTARRLGFRWSVYRDAALALAGERRETGRDRLQRGEPLPLDFPDASPREELEWNTRRWWARQALADGYTATARKQARRVVALAPAKLASWLLLARALWPGLFRLLVPNRPHV